MEDINVKVAGTMAAIKTWDWDSSVEKIQGLYLNSWKKVSIELLEELVNAKRNIGSKVGNPHGRYTWKKFISDSFGKYPTQRTVDTWISRHEMGASAWAIKQQAKGSQSPKPIDFDSQFIVSRKANKDGTYTVKFSVSEYPDTIFEETITVSVPKVAAPKVPLAA